MSTQEQRDFASYASRQMADQWAELTGCLGPLTPPERQEALGEWEEPILGLILREAAETQTEMQQEKDIAKGQARAERASKATGQPIVSWHPSNLKPGELAGWTVGFLAIKVLDTGKLVVGHTR